MQLGLMPRVMRAVLTVLLLASATALAACGLPRDMREPQVVLENVRPAGGGLFSQQVEIDLRITNPNDFPLPLTGLLADLDVNGQPFVRGVSDDRKSIPRLGSETVTLTASVSTFELAQQIFNVARGETDFTYDLTGTAYLGGGFARSQIGFQQEGGFRLTPDPEGPGNRLQPLTVE